MADDFARSILNDNAYARSQRQQWDTLWQDIADYSAPRFANFTTQDAPGQKRGTKIVNSIGVRSARECAIRVNGFLTGPGTTWFALRVDSDRAEQDYHVRRWLQGVERLMYRIFNSPDSRWGASMESVYPQLVHFGNGPMFIGEGPDGFPRFRAEFLGNCSVWTDDDGAVIAVFREYQQTAHALLRQFGKDNLPHIVQQALATEPQRQFTCVHGIRPRNDNDPFDIAGKPLIEGYVLKQSGDLLEEPKGYWEMPWVWPRWSRSPNEAYGRGPGEDALADVRMLQSMDSTIIKHAHMNVDPQWLMEHDAGVAPRINQVPGGYVYGTRDNRGWNVERLGPTGRANEAWELRAAVEEQVKGLYFLDAFKLVEKISAGGSVVHMSATEFAGRQADQMRMAGPALEMLRAEMLFPVISRVARILVRNGKVPLPPPQLRGAGVYPEYVSPLAMAQRGSDRAAILQMINDVITLAQVDNRVLDIFNMNRAGQVLGRALHVPVEALNSPEEMAAIAQARADAAAQAMQVEQTAALAGAAKDNAQAMQAMRGA